MLEKIPSMGEVWIFSGTTQFSYEWFCTKTRFNTEAKSLVNGLYANPFYSSTHTVITQTLMSATTTK